VILPPPRNRHNTADYARAVNACLQSTSAYLQISIRLPIYDPRSTSPNSLSQQQQDSDNVPLTVNARAPDGDLSSTWEMWDVIRTICGYNPRLTLSTPVVVLYTAESNHSVALDLSLPLPLSSGVLSRWTSEPCCQIFLPATSFISNAKGYPVLTKATQNFLRNTFKHLPTVLLARTRSKVHQSGGHLAYAQYVRHLEQTSPASIAAKQPGTLENFAKGYWDYLQAPLQVSETGFLQFLADYPIAVNG
jgi:type II protein arginine methyltransferase